MTQSIPSQSQSMANEAIRHKRLMELVEAEDAANGEIGCGRDWGDKLSVYLSTCGINVSDEGLRILLREHLGHVLMERDFDSIATQVHRQIEALVVQAHTQSERSQQLPTSLREAASRVSTKPVVEHIPTEELRQLFDSELGEFCSEAALEQLLQFTHRVVNQAVQSPRHTWPKPLWVLISGEKVYIIQTSDLEDAIAKVKAQYPQETGTLEVVTVGGVLAPEPVISLDRTTLRPA